ncbi:Copper chaperone for superoxide dismutase [Hondaea fermentalgiana]|uniref:Copper chaperone for superoxide dismutase n=1 Tax=Hondaea fermentalgiana TaxID=2315210 RepID=A0A2R5GME8_9STRA|nr:Copper chaperone for superoxide dismutase [Hondaea fermentalgiana]|eukprot:GBG32057.1 Copper chaperone for superoxide dismutase [Hondaea fermentalgiana]
MQDAESGAMAAAAAAAQDDDLLTYELFVKMSCESCAKTVRGALDARAWEVVQIDVPTDLVVVRSAAPAKAVVEEIESVGFEAAIIGTSAGLASDGSITVPDTVGSFEESVSVIGEFRGEAYGHGNVVGVVRIIQRSNNVAALQVSLGGLKAGASYSVAIHCFGDPRPGKQGGVFEGADCSIANAPTSLEAAKDVPGFLCSAIANESGEIDITKAVRGLRVWEAIGRGMVVHADDDSWTSLATCVVARSAVVGANHKKVCTCDGTIIWEAK